MFWQRRSPGLSHGPGATVDLKTTVGMPGRLLFAEGFAGNRMTDLPCTVAKVDRSEIVVELLHTSQVPQPESAVILEVANHTALLQCFTTVASRLKEKRISLRTPARPHILQRRRFPRLELFLGVTMTTADRPIEPMAAQMTNLSVDGAACVLAEPLPPGSTVRLNLTPIGLHPPEADATVIRCTATPSHLWILGLQFQKLCAEQELYLTKYIADFLQRQGQS